MILFMHSFFYTFGDWILLYNNDDEKFPLTWIVMNIIEKIIIFLLNIIHLFDVWLVIS